MSCAGSPGRMRTITKTRVSTANSVATPNAARRMRNAIIPDQCSSPLQARSVQEMRLLRHRRIEIVLPSPKLELLIDGNAADGLDDLLLRRLPQFLLLCRISLHARGADFVVRDIAVREVRHGSRRADDGGGVVELREVHVSNREARRLIVNQRRQIFPDLRVVSRMLDVLDVEIDADLLELRLDRLDESLHARERRMDGLDR